MIPKENNHYSNTLDDFAAIDNKLAKSQTDIGESSNLAQIAQTYDYSFSDSRYSDYVCILSVLAQVSIDSAKRMFDIDVTEEIRRIKKDMNVSENKYPKFWSVIKKDFNYKNINEDLICPMNYLYDLDFNKYHSTKSTLPMDHFFVKHPLEKKRKQCKNVEDLIVEYSFKLTAVNIDTEADYNDWLLVRSDFEKLLSDIQKTYISTNYQGLMSWLINRTFAISPYVQAKSKTIQSQLSKNRVALIKVLYSVSPKSFLACFKVGEK